MNLKHPVLACSLVLAVASASGQKPAENPFGPALAEAPTAQPQLTRFSLDFPGGTSAEFAQAVRKASGKPCNLIVAPQSADLRLPALKLANVTLMDLFAALGEISAVRVYNDEAHESAIWAVYSFQTREGTVTDDSVWFLQGNPYQEAPHGRFYNLTPYLDTFTVDDITTALNTAWRLMGEPAPKLTFHKETKLLIVVGTKAQFALIDEELMALAASIDLKKQAADKALPKPEAAAKP